MLEMISTGFDASEQTLSEVLHRLMEVLDANRPPLFLQSQLELLDTGRSPGFSTTRLFLSSLFLLALSVNFLGILIEKEAFTGLPRAFVDSCVMFQGFGQVKNCQHMRLCDLRPTAY